MDNETLFEVFKAAIVNEHNAYEFYLKAAKDSSNIEAKKLFENFAATELGHRTQLEELYKTLKK
ncbi:MAG TPA: ferritin family protein [Nitrospirota bacterium]|nr:ferritin family protein [Nitrospirota bacterium]